MPFVKGESGNPGGRPPGSRNKATVLVEAMLAAEGEGLARGLISKAREGDSGALRLCLDQVLPRGADRPLHFALPRVDCADAAREAVADVIAATGAGEVTPREAHDLLRVIERGARALAAAEVAAHAAEQRSDAPGDGGEVAVRSRGKSPAKNNGNNERTIDPAPVGRVDGAAARPAAPVDAGRPPAAVGAPGVAAPGALLAHRHGTRLPEAETAVGMFLRAQPLLHASSAPRQG
jgi:hypothetical protein